LPRLKLHTAVLRVMNQPIRVAGMAAAHTGHQRLDRQALEAGQQKVNGLDNAAARSTRNFPR
jgi:hypothetical protein